jgi:hypothetical protein
MKPANRSSPSRSREAAINSDGEFPNRQGLISGKLIRRTWVIKAGACGLGGLSIIVARLAHYA